MTHSYDSYLNSAFRKIVRIFLTVAGKSMVTIGTILVSLGRYIQGQLSIKNLQ